MIEPIRVVRTTPHVMAFIPLTIPREDVRSVMGAALAELKAAVAARGGVVTGPWFTHHVRNPGAIFDFEICVPLDTPIVPIDRVRSGQWPAMSVARTTYHGGYEGLGLGMGRVHGGDRGRRASDC